MCTSTGAICGTTVLGTVIGTGVTNADAPAEVLGVKLVGPALPATQSLGERVLSSDLAQSLPFTGTSHLQLMVMIALTLLVAGVLAVGLARRHTADDLAG